MVGPKLVTSRRVILGLNVIGCIIIALILFASAVGKAINPLEFTSVLSQYGIVNAYFEDGLVTILSTIELLLAFCLLLRIRLRASALLASLLFCVYTLALMFSLISGNTDHSCGCFSSINPGSNSFVKFLVGGNTISWSDVIRDLVLLAITLVIYFTSGRMVHSDNRVGKPLQRRLANVLILLISVGFGATAHVNLGRMSSNPIANPMDYHPKQKPIPVGTFAPDFKLSSLSGQRYDLKEYRNHVVLVDFFALWCPHCQSEEHIINSLSELFPRSKFQVLSIVANPYNMNYEVDPLNPHTYTPEDVLRFQNTFHVRSPILIDSNFSTSNLFLGNGFPTIYILDKSGVIRQVFQGTTSEQTLVKSIKNLM